jgi:DNA-binding response OmpR family regulator
MIGNNITINGEGNPDGIKLLLLEDDPFLLKFYLERFKSFGFNLFIEDDEDEGFDLALSCRPDVIILDISLPKGDDFDFITKIKNNPILSQTPVVVLTDLNDEYDKKRGLAAGAQEYMVRDELPLQEVADKIRALVAIKK